MSKIVNAKILADENTGKRIVKYDVLNKNGELYSTEVCPYFGKDGKENPKALDILKASAANEILDKVKAQNEKNDLAITEGAETHLADKESPEVNPAAVLPEHIEVNKGKLKKGKWKLIRLVAFGALCLVTIHGTKSCTVSKLATEEPVTQETNLDTQSATEEDTIADEAKSKVEGAVEEISYDDAVVDMADISDNWEKAGYDKVSQRSLNSLYFITNYDMFTKETLKEMVDNNVVAQEPMTIIADSLEALSVCQDQGGKAVTGQDKKILDMSMFCVRAEDKELVTYAYNQLKTMQTANDNKAQDIFNSYYHYLNNEETTNFPILYNEADKGVNFLLNQAYGGVFSIGGAHHGIAQSKVDFIHKYTGMNDFSSALKEMQKCLGKLEGYNVLSDENTKRI